MQLKSLKEPQNQVICEEKYEFQLSLPIRNFQSRA